LPAILPPAARHADQGGMWCGVAREALWCNESARSGGGPCRPRGRAGLWALGAERECNDRERERRESWGVYILSSSKRIMSGLHACERGNRHAPVHRAWRAAHISRPTRPRARASAQHVRARPRMLKGSCTRRSVRAQGRAAHHRSACRARMCVDRDAAMDVAPEHREHSPYFGV